MISAVLVFVVIVLYTSVLLGANAISYTHAAPTYGVIVRPVANLRAAKSRLVPRYDLHDPHQNTQLQFGECVELVNHEDEDWYSVKTVNSQFRFKAQEGWSGYDGYVESRDVIWFPRQQQQEEGEEEEGEEESDLPPRSYCPRRDVVVSQPWTPLYRRECSIKNGCLEQEVLLHVTIGTTLELCHPSDPLEGRLGWVCVNAWADGKQLQAHVLAADVMPVNRNNTHRDTLPDDTDENRRVVLAQASRLLGYPYFWGGYSARSLSCGCHSADDLTGVDCSGLTGLALRSSGVYVAVPRDAHDMFLITKNITHPKDILPGDLLFFANDRGRMTHVMAYWGDNTLIEATATSNSTRIVSLEERFGNGVESIEHLRWGMPSKYGTIFYGTPFVKRGAQKTSLTNEITLALLIIAGSVAVAIPMLIVTVIVIKRASSTSHATASGFSDIA